MTQHDDDSQNLLEKLGDTNLTLSNPSDDIRSHKVVDANGEALGHVSALFTDKKNRKVRFLQVGAGGFLGMGEREFLVPIEDLSSTSRAEVRINHSRDHVVAAPHFDPKLTTNYTHDFFYPYYGYYGISPYWGRMY
ncbi:PRC-barrel domain containing protein [Deinococcus psychrotolerans]|uniref:PRC-barrel domain containing protein n=1 Tax=Deinococcus psychrotolerans TaxID=2489213 RepID=A0A3G8YFX4_9DEIO|nr:PRC-barrel domain-containing protein [Deinococcus psychrotolerans]AZI44202.1 PRC-barrel domain containing protein [Deinococcus psychrotolerans]